MGVVTPPPSLILAAVVYAPFTPFLCPGVDPLTPSAVISVVVLAVFCTAIAFLVMFAPLIAEAGPARMTLITYVNPAVAPLLLGALVLHEPITLGPWSSGSRWSSLGSAISTRRPATPVRAATDLTVGRDRRRAPRPGLAATDQRRLASAAAAEGVANAHSTSS